jgi:hypothetical protein
MSKEQLESIRKIRKAKKTFKKKTYKSLKQYAMDCIEFGIPSQAYGKGAEKIVKTLCSLHTEQANDRGDFEGGIEMKFSIANNEGKVNFVQLRPSYNIDHYMLVIYDPGITGEDLFEVLICKAVDLYSLLPEFGGYAHGTVEANGEITASNIEKNLVHNCEYALRPSTRSTSKKGYKLLKKLREINLIEEEQWEKIKKNLV